MKKSVVIIVILLFAGVVRVLLARAVYPAPDDGAHFVQHGIALAHGNPQGLSTYWSQGMILVAAFAEKMGLLPGKVLQYFSVACGIAVVLWLLLFTWSWFGSWRAGVTVGVLAACNTPLSQYAASSYSEMPFMACACGAMAGFAHTIKNSRGWLLPIASAALLGFGAYFKGADACVWALILYLYWVVDWFIHDRQKLVLARLLMSIAVFLAAILPLCTFTYQRTGAFAPGIKSWGIAVGDDHKDSKKAYAIEKPWAERAAYLREHGMIGFMWHYKAWLLPQWSHHMIDACRIYADMVARGPFRIGPGWMVGLVVLGGVWLVLYRGRPIRLFMLPGVMLVGVTAIIAVALMYYRLLVPSFVFFLSFLGVLVSDVIEAMSGRKALAIPTYLVAFAFVVNSASLSIHAGPPGEPNWRYLNMMTVGEKLKQFGDDNDIMMVSGPHIPIHFYRYNPMKHVEVPFASIEATEQYAEQRNVSLIVLSDRWRGHWPINRLFTATAVPTNWTEIARFRFPGDPYTDIPDEQYLVFRRRPAEK